MPLYSVRSVPSLLEKCVSAHVVFMCKRLSLVPLFLIDETSPLGPMGNSFFGGGVNPMQNCSRLEWRGYDCNQKRPTSDLSELRYPMFRDVPLRQSPVPRGPVTRGAIHGSPSMGAQETRPQTMTLGPKNLFTIFLEFPFIILICSSILFWKCSPLDLSFIFSGIIKFDLYYEHTPSISL